MKTLYVTYQQHGNYKRGVISQRQYESYLKDSSIENLQIHGSQTLMEEHYNSSTGKVSSTKQLLHG